jgi:putative hydrolase of the HAD superfamily
MLKIKEHGGIPQVNSSDRPKVIFFDAVGTLFGVKGSVGQIYAAIAQEFNVQADPAALNQAFIQNFKTASKMTFPEVERSQIPELEYQWWYAIAHSSFSQTGFINQFQDFDRYFQRLYAYFATADAWYLYEEVPAVLSHLQKLGLELAVISNFDSRLYPVLEVLNLAQFFSSVTISTEVGAAKPDRQIFISAMDKHQPQNQSSYWHIGDSFKEDYEGAKNANITPIWLNRDGDQVPDHVLSIPSLSALLTGSYT